jgi:ASC-1-like (ASCH) protein
MTNYHLVILKKPFLDAILSGRKQIESRFTKTRRPAFGRVFGGDTLFLKESGGPVCAMATVAEVKNFENLTPKKIIELKHQYRRYIGGSDELWQSKMDSRFCFLVWLKDIRTIEPVRIHKKDWRAWVILQEKADFGLLNLCRKTQ